MTYKPIIFIFLLGFLVFFSGCIDNNDTTNLSNQNQQIEDDIGDFSTPEYRYNCRELDGHLCSSEGQCALSWLDSSDSYCCPIECNTCDKKIAENCNSDDVCTNAVCGSETNFNCEFRDITPCANNGICEEGEIETCNPSSGYSGEITGPALCCPTNTHAVMSKTSENSDCPKNCDDSDDNTADYYDFTAQKCEHYDCASNTKLTIAGSMINETTYDLNNVLVTIKLYDVVDKGIGEYISIKNNRDDIVIIGTGCNYPISNYADNCMAWSLRPYEEYPTFYHTYIEPNLEVNGWVWGIDTEFLEYYNTSLITATIIIDGEELSFVKNIDDIDTFEEMIILLDENINYKFDDYYSYQKYVAEELEVETGVEDIGKYGSYVSTRFNGSVYFLMTKSDSWGEIYRFWAVQVNAETGDLIKYQEIANDGCSGQLGSCPNMNELWWTPQI